MLLSLKMLAAGEIFGKIYLKANKNIFDQGWDSETWRKGRTQNFWWGSKKIGGILQESNKRVEDFWKFGLDVWGSRLPLSGKVFTWLISWSLLMLIIQEIHYTK